MKILAQDNHAVVVNPDADLRRIAVEEDWEVVRLDRLGRRLKMLAALGAGTALAGLGRVVAERAAAARPGAGSPSGRAPRTRTRGRRATSASGKM